TRELGHHSLPTWFGDCRFVALTIEMPNDGRQTHFLMVFDGFSKDDFAREVPMSARPNRRRMARIDDVARLSGVSTATVDRVLNQRPGVRAITVQRVLKAASELGYLMDGALPAQALKPWRLAFLLPAGTNRYLALLGRLIGASQDQLASFNMRARVERIESFKPELLAHELKRVGREVDGIAFMAIEHPAVRDAVDALAERGVPTVTLISDIA